MLEVRHHPLQMKTIWYTINIMNKLKYKAYFIKLGLGVFIAILFSFAVAQAGTITPPSGTPVAQFYTLSEIYEFITNNTTATAGGHSFTFADALAGTGNTLTQIYDALVALISADKVKLGTTYLNVAGTLTPDGGTGAVADLFNGKTAHLTNDWTLDTGTLNLACNTATFNATANLVATAYDGSGDGSNRWCMKETGDVTAAQMKTGVVAWVDGAEVTGTGTQTLSAANETVSAGYYDATTLSAVDTDLIAGNILSGATIFGVAGNVSAGYTYGDSVQSTVLTTATGAGTYNASNLTVGNVRYGQTFGVSSTGTMSPYPNTPSGISGLNQTVCTDAGWTWVADSNNDGTSDDPICVNPNREAATKVWNTSVGNDNTFIGNYGCSGDTDGDGVGTLNTTLSGTVSENTGYGDDVAVALAIADCKDGIRNLLTKVAVETAGYTAPDTDCTPTANDCYNGPLTSKALIEWKGTRLPSYNDFFSVCGNGTNSTTFGDYGNQIGRTNNVITANAGSWEWLSESRSYNTARLAGFLACSNFSSNSVAGSYGLRVVFRP